MACSAMHCLFFRISSVHANANFIPLWDIVLHTIWFSKLLVLFLWFAVHLLAIVFVLFVISQLRLDRRLSVLLVA